MLENNNIFKINRIIITIFTFILFNLFIINEDSSWIFIPFLFTGISFVLLLITEKIVNKIIQYGDNLKNNLFKFLYYFILFPFLIIIGILGITFFIAFVDNLLPKEIEFADALGNALKLVLLGIVMILILIIPYVNTILYLIIRRILKKKKIS